MVNDLIRLDDQTNYENTQQKFEWTRTSLVIILSLFIGKSDSNLKLKSLQILFSKILPFLKKSIRLELYSLNGLKFVSERIANNEHRD